MTPVATPFFFYTLAALASAGSTLVVTRRKPVHAALALLVTLLAIAGLYLMLYAPFVAGVQVALCAVAMTSLFLFAIVLLNLLRNLPVNRESPSHSILRFADRDFSRVWPVGLAAGFGLLAWFTYALVRSRTLFPDRMMSSPQSSNTQQITTLLYGENARPGQYIFSLEIASLLLLVTIIGAAIQVASSRSVIAPLKKEARPSADEREEPPNH